MKVKEPWKICSRLKKTKGTCQLHVNLIHGHNLLRQKKKKEMALAVRTLNSLQDGWRTGYIRADFLITPNSYGDK